MIQEFSTQTLQIDLSQGIKSKDKSLKVLLNKTVSATSCCCEKLLHDVYKTSSYAYIIVFVFVMMTL